MDVIEVIYMSWLNKSYQCPKCNKSISPNDSTCKYCGFKQPPELRATYLEAEIVDIECKECGCKQSFFTTSDTFDIAECIECGEETFYDDTGKSKHTKPMQVECPYCHSTNTKKISTTSKVGSVALFGIFAIGKVSKQWHCNNCKSDF